MKSISNRLLALLSAAALIIAVGACKQPSSNDTNIPESQPGMAPENTPPAPEPADEAGGGPTDNEMQPETQPADQPADQIGDQPADPAGGGPDMNDPAATQPGDQPEAMPAEPTGGGPATELDEKLKQSREKINEGLDEMRNIASEQAATGEDNAKRAAEDLQDRANEAQKSIESGIEKLKQEMKPADSP